MPILADLSRRFHLLTTDAKPDPPRVQIEGHTHNVPPERPSEKSKAKSKSLPTTPENELEHSHMTSTERQKSVPNEAVPVHLEYPMGEPAPGSRPSPSDSREPRKPGAKAKAKARQSKYSQGTNVVNYNIVNSNGVKIGSKTSYICNLNQATASNGPSPEGSWSKPKFRQMPTDVERLTICTEEITMDDIFLIKTHVGHGWRDVARRLSYSDGQIEQFEENYRHRGVDEVIYQLLLDWKQANTKDAELGNLMSILWACQQYDCAERLALTRKDPSSS